MKTVVLLICSGAMVALAAAKNHEISRRQSEDRHSPIALGPGPVIFPPWPISPICRWNCAGNEHTLEITNNAKDHLLSVYSEFSKIALVHDSVHHLAAIYNGSSGEIAVSDLRNSCHYHVENTPVLSWTASASSWNVHFKKLHSLTPLYQEALRQNIEECAYDEHTPVFSALAKGYVSLGSFLPPKETHQMLVELSEHLSGPLGNLYKNSSSFSIKNNLEWFLKVNLALAQLLNNGTIGPVLNKANFDLKLIFGQSSAFEGLLNFFIHLAPHCDVLHAVLPLISNEERMLILLSRLAGGSDKGIDGLLNVITKIVLFLHGKVDINDVIATIVNYTPDGADVRLNAIVNKYLKFIASQQRIHHAPPAFHAFIDFLQALNDHNLVLSNVNVSDIIKLLSNRKPAETIPTVLKILARFNPSRGIPQFFRFIVAVLNGTQDPRLLTNLIPGLNLTSFNGKGNILQQVLHGQNLSAVLHQGVTALEKIPIFGQVVKGIESAFPNANLTQYLSPETILHHIQQAIGNGIEAYFGGIAHGIESILGAGGNSSSSGDVVGGLSQILGGGGNGSGHGETSISGGSSF